MKRPSSVLRRAGVLAVVVLAVAGATSCEPPPPSGFNSTSWSFYQAWLRNDREAARKLTSSNTPVNQIFATDRVYAKTYENGGCRSARGREDCFLTNGWHTLGIVRATADPGKIYEVYEYERGIEPFPTHMALYIAWRNGDRTTAKRFATPDAVNDLFLRDPNKGTFEHQRYRTCYHGTDSGVPTDICEFEGTIAGLVLSGRPGYKVDRISEY